MASKEIDLNCDMGESYGRFKIGNDEVVMQYISSCNIACGFHGGDPLTIQRTIELALKNGVKVGAHPGFPDLQGFGRRSMQLPEEELFAIMQYQVAAVKGMTEAAGGKLRHVKPHGALYNMAAKDDQVAEIIVKAILSIDPQLVLYGPPNSSLTKKAKSYDLVCKNEVFADRNYNEDLSLVDRQNSNALISEIQSMFEHVLYMLRDGKVKTISGVIKAIKAQTICIHGDKPNAGEVARFLSENLQAAGFYVR
ncbi:MAG: LamB/YcsF family protein [Bacteroidetes bacterium]|nr:MAG: LamB/YcsF family protein [Bacteroidota bacterium]